MSDDQGTHLPEFDVTDGPLTFQCFTYNDGAPDLPGHLGTWAPGRGVPNEDVFYHAPSCTLHVKVRADDLSATLRAFRLSHQPKGTENAADLVVEVTSIDPEDHTVNYHRSAWVVGFQSPPDDANDRSGIACCLMDGYRLETYGERWWMMGLSCQVSLNGHCITESEYDYALWGIESDAGESYFKEVFTDLVEDAKADLPEVLERLEEDALDAADRVKTLHDYLQAKQS